MNVELRNQILALSTGGEIDAAAIATATDLISHEGASTESVDYFITRFQNAELEGRLPAETRRAFRDSLLSLLSAIPEEATSVLELRQQQAAPEDTLLEIYEQLGATRESLVDVGGKISEAKLRQQLHVVREEIKGYRAEIAQLEQQIAATERSISNNFARVKTLQARRRDLLEKIRQTEVRRNVVAVISALFFGPVGIAAAVGVVAMSQREIKGIRAEIQGVDADSANLRALETRYESQRNEFTHVLSGLRQRETQLVNAIGAHVQPSELSGERLTATLTNTRALADNLREQVTVLRGHLSMAKSVNAELDAVVKVLEAEVKNLEVRYEKSQMKLIESVLNLVFKISGISKTIRAGGFSFSKAKLLVRGSDYLAMSIRAQVDHWLKDAIVSGLLHASDAQLGANTIFAMLDIADGSTSVADVAKLVGTEVLGELTEPQRLLLSVFCRRSVTQNVEAEVKRVLADATITDEQARQTIKSWLENSAPAAVLNPTAAERDAWDSAAAQVETLSGEFVAWLGSARSPQDLAGMIERAKAAQTGLPEGIGPARALASFATTLDAIDPATPNEALLGYASSALQIASAGLTLHA